HLAAHLDLDQRREGAGRGDARGDRTAGRDRRLEGGRAGAVAPAAGARERGGGGEEGGGEAAAGHGRSGSRGAAVDSWREVALSRLVGRMRVRRGLRARGGKGNRQPAPPIAFSR